jgi:hypothetical protein
MMTGERWTVRRVLLVVLATVVGTAAMSSAADKSAQCVATKLTAAGKYAACRLKADAKVAKIGGSPDYSKCDTKFLKAFERAESKAGSGVCPREGDSTAVSSCLGQVTSQCAPLVQGCDGTGNCESCSACAQTNGGPCVAAVEACFSDVECSAFNDCIIPCGDQACVDACSATYPNGAALYAAAVACIYCDACPSDCDGASAGCP